MGIYINNSRISYIASNGTDAWQHVIEQIVELEIELWGAGGRGNAYLLLRWRRRRKSRAYIRFTTPMAANGWISPMAGAHNPVRQLYVWRTKGVPCIYICPEVHVQTVQPRPTWLYVCLCPTRVWRTYNLYK